MTASGHGTLTQCLSQEGYDDNERTWYGTLTRTVCLRRGTMTVSGHGTVR